MPLSLISYKLVSVFKRENDFFTGGVGARAAGVNKVGKSGAKTMVKSVAGKALKLEQSV